MDGYIRSLTKKNKKKKRKTPNSGPLMSLTPHFIKKKHSFEEKLFFLEKPEISIKGCGRIYVTEKHYVPNNIWEKSHLVTIQWKRKQSCLVLPFVYLYG